MLPKNILKVSSFVQLVQYSAKFIPNFSQEAEPLRKLLRKEHAFVWGILNNRKHLRGLSSLCHQAKQWLIFRISACKTRIVAVFRLTFSCSVREQPNGLGQAMFRSSMIKFFTVCRSYM